jgi:hypothetical protein
MAGEEDQKNASWLVPLRAALAQIPEDYPHCYQEITQIRHQMLKEIAGALQARLNEHVQSLPQTTFVEKQEIAKMVNRDLRLLNLCVRCPTTGGPAILVADCRDSEERTSRFRFQIVDPSGHQLRKNVSPRVPTLELQEAPPREENFASRIDRSRRGGNIPTL